MGREGREGGGGGGRPPPGKRGGGGGPPKKIFLPLRALFWSKNKGGRGCPAPPGSATEIDDHIKNLYLL